MVLVRIEVMEKWDMKFTSSHKNIKNTPTDISLVVQWLRFHLQGCWFNPCSGSYDPTCLRAKKTKHKADSYFNRFNENFKKMVHIKKSLKNPPHLQIERFTQNIYEHWQKNTDFLKRATKPPRNWVGQKEREK